MADRPPPDPAKLCADVEAWRQGDQLPGRTMANLKTAGLRTLLEAVAASGEADAEAAASALSVWMRWEKGQLVPGEALPGLVDAGLVDLLTGRAPA